MCSCFRLESKLRRKSKEMVPTEGSLCMRRWSLDLAVARGEAEEGGAEGSGGRAGGRAGGRGQGLPVWAGARAVAHCKEDELLVGCARRERRLHHARALQVATLEWQRVRVHSVGVACPLASLLQPLRVALGGLDHASSRQLGIGRQFLHRGGAPDRVVQMARRTQSPLQRDLRYRLPGPEQKSRESVSMGGDVRAYRGFLQHEQCEQGPSAQHRARRAEQLPLRVRGAHAHTRVCKIGVSSLGVRASQPAKTGSFEQAAQ